MSKRPVSDLPDDTLIEKVRFSSGFWKRSVEIETVTKLGTSDSKDAAMNAARRVIDNAFNPKKRNAELPLFA
jgi:hypothetical protein